MSIFLSYLLAFSILPALKVAEIKNDSLVGYLRGREMFVSKNSNLTIDFEKEKLLEILKESGLKEMRIKMFAYLKRKNGVEKIVVPFYTAPNRTYNKNYWKIEPLTRSIRFEGGKFISTFIPTAINLNELAVNDGDEIMLVFYYMETYKRDSIFIYIKEKKISIGLSVKTGVYFDKKIKGPFGGVGISIKVRKKNPSFLDHLIFSPSIIFGEMDEKGKIIPGFCISFYLLEGGILYNLENGKYLPFLGLNLSKFLFSLSSKS